MFLLDAHVPMMSKNAIPMLFVTLMDLWVCMSFCVMSHVWAIFSMYDPDALHCYRGLLKSEQSLAPVVKPNNLIPPNVPTSLSSYMSHNVIRAIFSYSSQSLSDRFNINNRENMCLLYNCWLHRSVPRTRREYQNDRCLSQFRSSFNKTDLWEVNWKKSFYGHNT